MLNSIRRTGLALILILVAAGNLPAQDAPSPVGDWEGVLSDPGQGIELTVVFHITLAGDGTYAATMDSPAQGAFGIQCGTPIVEGTSLEVPVAAVQGGLEGTIAEDGSKIDGTWSQGGRSFDLVLTPVKTENDG